MRTQAEPEYVQSAIALARAIRYGDHRARWELLRPYVERPEGWRQLAEAAVAVIVDLIEADETSTYRVLLDLTDAEPSQ